MKYTLLAAKLLTQDPLQLAMMSINSRGVEIEKLKKNLKSLIDHGKQNSIDSNRLNTIKEEKIDDTRIEKLEKVLQVLIPSKKRFRRDPITIKSILKRVNDLESNVDKFTLKPNLQRIMIFLSIGVIIVVVQPHHILSHKVLLQLSLMQVMLMIIAERSQLNTIPMLVD